MSWCCKSFIEKVPVSSVTRDALYKTDKDFQDAAIGIYHGLRNQYENMWYFGGIRGDAAWIQVSNQPSTTGADVFSINSSDALLSNTPTNYYMVISRANNVLTKITDADRSFNH
jgi:hypothetical protein